MHITYKIGVDVVIQGSVVTCNMINTFYNIMKLHATGDIFLRAS